MVTRETSIAAGLAEMAIEASPEAVARLARFAEILEDRAIREGFLGPNEVGKILSRHILESCALAPLLPRAGPLVDVGSGAGLPGIPLACLRADPVTLLDSKQRRARYLADVLGELGLAGEARSGRAEEFARTSARGSFAAATCRALAPPPVVLELCIPFVAIGGALVWPLTPVRAAGEPQDGAISPAATTHGVAETAAPPARADTHGGSEGPASAAAMDLDGMGRVAGRLGGGGLEVVGLEVPGADASRWAMIVHKFNETPDRFPRRTGVPARRPLE
jgi:16S rRNA (guanine(527)-N(7))-methyltransferase RsmG